MAAGDDSTVLIFMLRSMAKLRAVRNPRPSFIGYDEPFFIMSFFGGVGCAVEWLVFLLCRGKQLWRTDACKEWF